MNGNVEDLLSHMNSLIAEVENAPAAPDAPRDQSDHAPAAGQPRFVSGPDGTTDLAPDPGNAPPARRIRIPSQIHDFSVPPPTTEPPPPPPPPPTAPAPAAAPPPPTEAPRAPTDPHTAATAQPEPQDEDDEDAVEKTEEPRRQWRDRLALRRPRAPAPGPIRRSGAEWFSDLSARRNSVILNGSAAATGAWGYGAFNREWDTGLPQTFLAWMRAAHAESTVPGTTPVTALVLGVLVVLGVVIASGIAFAFLHGLFKGQTTLCAVLHWIVVRVPVTSALIALALFQA